MTWGSTKARARSGTPLRRELAKMKPETSAEMTCCCGLIDPRGGVVW